MSINVLAITPTRPLTPPCPPAPIPHRQQKWGQNAAETVKGAFETQDTFETLSFYDNYFMVIWILLFTFAPDKKEPYEESICHQRICGPRILL